MNYAKHLVTPQSEPLVSQVPNSGGGFSYAVDDWTRLHRFLVLGSEDGSYYASEGKLTRENAQAVCRCIAADGKRAVREIVAVSEAGRAPKNDPALFALALAAKTGDLETRREAMGALNRVARIGTHLFHFAEYVKALGGWGRGTTRAFARWYLDQTADDLVYQAIKYQQRDGWSHRDILRKSHPKTADPVRQAVFHWIAKGWDTVGKEPHPDAVLRRIWAFETAKTARGKDLIRLIRDFSLPHECVPNEAKSDPDVWAAMLPSMGLAAVVRNLGKLTAVGVLKPLGVWTATVAARLVDADAIVKARLHPLSLLVALKTYAQGHSDKGKLAWQPTQNIVDALDRAFYAAFQAVESTGKRTMLALDVSGSMNHGTVCGSSLTPREASAAMALVTATVEPRHMTMAFSSQFVPLAISPRNRLDDVIKATNRMPFTATDCAVPIVYAYTHKLEVDAFVIYTDSETNCGPMHAMDALRRYRQLTGIPAKLVVAGMVSNGFTIADPNDGGAMDVVGFDTSTPAVMADFIR